MPRISVLPEHIASQIAAGEVVERPASVVKELVENSIDAGATRVVVDISEECRHIRVADNGCGMEAADAALAFQRHATSKLASADDLWNLHTLGFRGEALPSIAAISHLTCLTRAEGQEAGVEVVCADGTTKVSETGCAKGTVIEVADLFYNVPARLKFLKKAATEFAHIFEIMQSLAITYPQIAFELSFDGNTRLKTLGSGKLEEALRESGFFNDQYELLDLNAKDNLLGMSISGKLVSPTAFRGDRKGILTIVNSRPVRCSLTYKALDYAYADLIPKGRYALAVVHLTVNPGELDINIHPTKKEIRYSKGNEVYLFVQRQIMQALRTIRNAQTDAVVADNASYIDDQTLSFRPLPEASHAFRTPRQSYIQQEESKQLSLRESETNHYPSSGMGINLTRDLTRDVLEGLARDISGDVAKDIARDFAKNIALPADWRLAGYIHNTYFLIETKSGFSIIEQHIAHERTLYEKLLSKTERINGGSAKDADEAADCRQNLLISLPLALSEEQKAVLKENIDQLEQQGFAFDISDQEVLCSQVPVELAHKDYARIIQAMLDDLAQNCQSDPRLEIIKSIACQSAVKNGMPLANEQIIELLSAWFASPRNDTCPHGRPIQLNFSKEKLFQMFHPH